jgi:hypothetical protein
MPRADVSSPGNARRRPRSLADFDFSEERFFRDLVVNGVGGGQCEDGVHVLGYECLIKRADDVFGAHACKSLCFSATLCPMTCRRGRISAELKEPPPPSCNKALIRRG